VSVKGGWRGCSWEFERMDDPVDGDKKTIWSSESRKGIISKEYKHCGRSQNLKSIDNGGKMKSVNQFRLISSLLILLYLFAHPIPAKACSCVVPGSPEEEFAKTDGVFAGKVARIYNKSSFTVTFIDSFLISSDQEPLVFRTDTFWGYRIIFDVSKSWKGVDATKVAVDTGTGRGDCGYHFNENHEYVVYINHAYGDPKKDWVTSICERTNPIEQGQEDLAYLNSLPVLPLRKIPFIFVFNLDTSLLIIGVGIILAIRFLKNARGRNSH